MSDGVYGKRTDDEERAFLRACNTAMRALQPAKQQFKDPFTGRTLYVTPSTSTCPEPTCIDGQAYHPDYGLIPCPVCNADACDKCGGTGMYVPPLPTDNVNFGKPVLCPNHCPAALRLQGEHTARLYAGAKLPAGYDGCTLDSFRELVSAAAPGGAEWWRGKMLAYHAVDLFITAADAEAPFFVEYAEAVARAAGKRAADVFADARNSLVLHGAHGVGKTGLAAAIVNALVPLGVAVRYTRTQDFIKAVQDRYGDDWHDAPPDDDFGDLDSGRVIDVVRKAPLLILDEFDMPDAARENKQSIVENVIRYRMNHVLPTVVTTNLDADGLEDRWGTTTLTVLKQRAHFIAMGGRPLRATPQTIVGVL